MIVGASLAGLKTATALREFGCKDEVLVIGGESELPYDRPPLSKSVLTDGLTLDDVLLTEEHELPDVEFHLGRRATSLDLEKQTVGLDSGEAVGFDTLVVATGATPRRLPWPDVAGVHYLRTFEDAVALREEMRPGRRLVVVGGGFIGAEAAAAGRSLGLDVTILEALPAPLSRVLGIEVGNALAGLHTRRGVELRCGAVVSGIDGAERVEGVHLSSGDFVPADLVVVGIGALPETGWLDSSGVIIDDGIVCDEYCKAVGTDNVYAVGDVARWRNPFYGESIRVEHWTNAVEQAAAVAQSIMGDPQSYEHIPYVWSHQYNHQIQMVGRILPAHQPQFVGSIDVNTPGFVALYGDGDLLTGAVALDSPRVIPKIKRLIRARASIQDALHVATKAAA
ncbi:NAD(P)/FAD-dependent oxidoreductase [Rhodococcus koreensis]